jgi:hypothetical protein
MTFLIGTWLKLVRFLTLRLGSSKATALYYKTFYAVIEGLGKTTYIVSARFRYRNGYIWQAILTQPNLPFPLT